MEEALSGIEKPTRIYDARMRKFVNETARWFLRLRMYGKVCMLPDRLALITYQFWQVVATHVTDKHLGSVTGTWSRPSRRWIIIKSTVCVREKAYRSLKASPKCTINAKFTLLRFAIKIVVKDKFHCNLKQWLINSQVFGHELILLNITK